MPLFKTIVAEGSGNQDDTYVGAWSSSNWDTARNVYIANTRLDSQSNSLNGVYSVKLAGRGGGSTWYNYRSLFSFDLDTMTGINMEKAEVKIKMIKYSGSGINHTKVCLVHMVESMNGNTGDYDGMLDGSDDMVLISDVLTTPILSATQLTFTLNAAGLAIVNQLITGSSTPSGSTRYFEVALVSYTYDYNDRDPVSNSIRVRVYYQEEGGTETPRLLLYPADYSSLSMGINF